MAHFLVHHGLGEGAGGNRVDDGLAKVVGAGHLHVQAVQHGPHGAVGTAPVAHGEALEAPLAAEDFVQQVLVLGAVVAVHLVVGRHHAHRTAFFNRPLEGLEIDLAQGALVDYDIHASPVGLLVVHGEVLDAYGGAFILHALGVTEGKGRGKHRVLAQVFIGTSAHRQALDIDGGTKDHVLAPEAGFASHAGAVFVGKFLAPGGSKGAARGEEGGGVKRPPGAHETIGLPLFANAEGAVGIVDVGDSQPLHACRRHVGLAVQHVYLFLQGHPGDEFVDGGVVDSQSVLR